MIVLRTCRRLLENLLLQNDNVFDRRFSLDLTYEEASQYAADFLHADPLRLHRLVAQDKLVAMRVFHWTVRLVIRTLFHCGDVPGQHADNIAAHAEPGIFGTAGYAGGLCCWIIMADNCCTMACNC